MEPLPHLQIPDWTPELEASFLSQGKIEESPSGCLTWTGPIFIPGGYGRFYVPSGEKGKAGRVYRAHRVIYAWRVGDPGEAVLNHVCHDPFECRTSDNYCIHRRCVNPDHLEPTTRGENVRKGLPGSPLWHPLGNSLKTHCDYGHEFTPENTYKNPKTGDRACKICKAARAAATYAEMTDEERDALNAKRRANREHITYDLRPCEACGLDYQPLRSTSRFCPRKACINKRQSANRANRKENK
jgi:hypothetical protein